MESRKSAGIGGTGAETKTTNMQKSAQQLWKIDVASRMRFWNVLGRPWGAKLLDFGSQNLQNIIVDAERHRRTPGTPVTWSKVIDRKKSANIGDAGAARNWKRIPKSSKYNWNSFPNQGCVAEAFLNSFGAALECQMVDFGSRIFIIFSSKIFKNIKI